MIMSVHAQLLQSCLTLCDAMDCSLSDSSLHGILQARTQEWVAMPSSRWSSRPRDPTRISCVSCIAGRSFATEPLGKPLSMQISSNKEQLLNSPLLKGLFFPIELFWYLFWKSVITYVKFFWTFHSVPCIYFSGKHNTLMITIALY